MKKSLALLVAVGTSACISPSPPPTHSFAKYTRLAGAGESSGQVSATVSAAIIESPDSGDEDPSLLVPIAEAAVALRPTDIWDVTVSANMSKLDVDGSLAFAPSERFRIALLHGVGLGALGDISPSGSVFADLTAGLLLEALIGGQSSAYLGGKYAYTIGTSDEFANTHWSGGALGINIGFDNVCVSPEIVLARMSMADAEDSLWFILPTLTVSALY